MDNKDQLPSVHVLVIRNCIKSELSVFRNETHTPHSLYCKQQKINSSNFHRLLSFRRKFLRGYDLINNDSDPIPCSCLYILFK